MKVDASEFRNLQAKLGQTERAFRAALPSVVAHGADLLLGAIRANFDKLAAGGLGADGTQWAPLTPTYAATKAARRLRRQIGIRTGNLRDSLDVIGQRGTEARVGFDAVHANLFDEQRPLIPDPIPRAWMRGIEQHAETKLGKILSAALQ